MCGICGIVRFDDRVIDAEALRRGCDALRHRGPDHTGLWIEARPAPWVGLGVTRLSVIDPAPSCHQPLHDPTGRYHLAFNGELYNFRSLRSELMTAGVSFRTHGDAEVVLAACAHWGEEALRRFDGIWGLGFFDASERRGFLARDRYGVKPLLYASSERELSFASEMRGLRAMVRLDKKIDAEALVHLLTFGFIADPGTIYASVRRLSPGNVLRFGPDGVISTGPWFSPDPIPVDVETAPDFSDIRAKVRRLIADAVVRQRIADVPMGAFLSGGIDSSIIVHHLAEASSQPIRTFCVGYAGSGAYNESAYARRVAERYGTEHYSLAITDREVIEFIPRLFDHLHEPVGDSSILPTAMVSRFAASHVTVALSGDGGDELFGGYWRYLGHEAMAAYRRLPGWARRRWIEPMLRRLESSRGSRLGNRVRQLRKLLRAESGDALDRHVAWCTILSPEAWGVVRDANRVTRCMDHVRAEAHRRTDDRNRDDPLNRVLAFDLSYQLPSDMLAKVDLASMMHSLEVRVPLLDPALVEQVAPWPSRVKVRRGLRKRLLVEAYRGRLPDEVLDRPKQGFEVPFGEYLRGPLRELFLEVATSDTLDSFDGLLDPAAIRAVLESHLTRRGDHADVLFAILSLCWWRRAGG